VLCQGIDTWRLFAADAALRHRSGEEEVELAFKASFLVRKTVGVFLRLKGERDMHASRAQIAIVGIGCRLPGHNDTPLELAQFLAANGDALTDIPSDRWEIDGYCSTDPRAPGKAYVKRGAFLHQNVFDFDPEPFAISPREADRMDPQQRLLLEVTWEAFEDAGIPFDRVRGSRTAVVVGAFTLDCQSLAYSLDNQRLIDVHTAVGTSMTILSNRISYAFDLRGPSFTVDTACSSSLVAVHLACQAILHDGCELALVGGVNVMLSPATLVTMCKGQFLAPDGRSKAFDARADGYGRGEGAAVVLLKPLDSALRDHDRIYAVIRASGVNQDGRTDGISLPNQAAQESLARSVLGASGLTANDVAYVEAHGTGTRAGDPVEARALGAVYGRGRARPLAIGSLKPNLGHLEAAAGVTGLIKAALSVHQRTLLPQFGPAELNPEIPFGDLGLCVKTHAQPWPTDAVAHAAINSFGYGGTNAHVIVSEWRAPAKAAVVRGELPGANVAPGPRLVPLSAMSEKSLLAFAARLEASVSDQHWSDQAYTLARRRTHLPERAVVLADSASQLRSELAQLIQGQPSDGYVRGRATGERRLVWVFTGMGPQWWAMGRELLELEPTFAHAVHQADQAFSSLAGWSPLEEMLRDEATSRASSNAIAQPTNFLVQVGLVRLLEAHGVPAHAVLGHSVGEVTAAWAAGCLSLEEATRVVYHRSRLQQQAAGKGTLLAAAISEERIRPWLADAGDVTIAAYNAPTSLTLAGSHADLGRIAARLEAEGVFHRLVSVEVAYHSPHMDPLQHEFLDSLRRLRPRVPNRPLYSTVSGSRVEQAVHDESYWWNNTRGPVMLERALRSALDDGYTALLEIGPHPVLAVAIREVLSRHAREGLSWHCMKRGQPERLTFLRTVAELHASGVALDWSLIHPEARLADLPHYAFQRERHSVESQSSREARMGRASSHPLLARRDRGPTPRFVADLLRPTLEYLKDHRIDGTVVFPGAAYIEAAIAARVELGNHDGECVLEDFSFERPLVVRPEAGPELLVDVDPDTSRIRFYGHHGEEPWERYAQGRIPPASRGNSLSPLDLSRLQAELAEVVDVGALYEAFSAMGLEYGPSFQGLREVRVARNGRGGGSVLARLGCDGIVDATSCVHPSLLDAGFQALLSLERASSRPWVPVSIERLRWMDRGLKPAWAYGSASLGSDQRLTASLVLAAEDGTALLELEGLVCRRLEQQASSDSSAVSDLLHIDTWQERPWPEALESRPETWALIGNASSFFRRLTHSLRSEGMEALVIDPPDRERMARCARMVFAVEWTPEDPVGILACDQLRQLVGAVTGVNGSSLVVVTFGAQPVAAEDRPSPSQAALWGLGRVIMTEHPELGCRLVDLPALEPEPQGTTIAVLSHPDMEEEVAVRGGRLFVRRLRRQTLEDFVPQTTSAVPQETPLTPSLLESTPQSLPLTASNVPGVDRDHPPVSSSTISTARELFRPDRTYLVTGGLSGFGLATAQWMVEQGARSLVLGSRRGIPDAEASLVIEALRDRARIECHPLDVTQPESIDDLLGYIDRNLPPLAGIFHSAMVLEDLPIRELSSESLRKVMLPKAYGAWLLHLKTVDRALDYFVLYSSVAALIGNPNQASYAAANACLDGLASLRRSLGLAATSVSWGAIGDVGVVASNPATGLYLRSLGFHLMSAQEALFALEYVLPACSAQVLIVNMDWGRWMTVMHRTLWNRLKELHANGPVDADDPLPLLSAEFADLDPETKRTRLRDRISRAVATVLRLTLSRLEPETPLRHYGLDSLMATEVQLALEESTGVIVPVIELLGGASVSNMVERVLERVDSPVFDAPCQPVALGVPKDLRAHALARICVQPPYFDLLDLGYEAEWVMATATPLGPSESEDDLVSCAEAARHLAILGSCAASLRCPLPGRVYYPVLQARYSASRQQKTRRRPLERVRLRARCTLFDTVASRATAETELLDMAGNPVAALVVDYHVIPERQFVQLFGDHREQTLEECAPNPYLSWTQLPTAEYSDGIVSSRLPPVDPLSCLGHFVKYPALPVSIMARYAIQLVAEGTRCQHEWEKASVTILRGSVRTEAFVFAHEPVTVRARRAGEGGHGHEETWQCDLLAHDRLAASFRFELVARIGIAGHAETVDRFSTAPPSGTRARAAYEGLGRPSLVKTR
jgi:acyl transferase domain-containing protein/acyl carrier protein